MTKVQVETDLEEVHGSREVDSVVAQRLLDRLTDSLQAGKVHHSSERMLQHRYTVTCVTGIGPTDRVHITYMQTLHLSTYFKHCLIIYAF